MLNEEIVKDLNNFAKKLLENENNPNFKIEIEGQTEIGDNYGGEVIFFNILTENEEKIYNLVMKTSYRSEILREVTQVEKAFKREIMMYSKVFPTFDKFCKEMNEKFSFDIIPKVYLTVDEPGKETIILENLKSTGYKSHDKQKKWNLNHSLFVMENFGKFHGISLAINEKQPETFKELSNNFPRVSTDMPNFDFDEFYEGYFKNTFNYLEEAGRKDLVEKYREYIKVGKSIIRNNFEEKDRTVISHADCWNNNIMFKYENDDESVPSKLCLIDFQACYILSPVFDLSYTIYTTCSDKENLEHFDLLIETYYKSLVKTMKDLGCTRIPFTFDDLMNQWKKYAIFGLFRAITIINIISATKENPLDLFKELEEGKSLQDALDLKILNVEGYKRRILNIFIHFGDRFLA